MSALTTALPPPRRLRAWQAEALAAYDAAAAEDFLVTATPGAGKTAFALTLAARLLDRREIARVIVVCPTDHLRTQWADAAAAVGIVLDPALPNSVGPVRADAQGYVTTYAQVAGKPSLHAARCSARRSLVVLDEVHHAGDGLTWGEATSEAFGRAARRLCLTGTPFRTRPGERIPFVRYAESTPDDELDGADAGALVSRADHTYSYRQALADGVVRPVVFAAYTGTARWRTSAGDVVAASLSEAGTRSTEAQAWRTALDPRGQWVPHVLAALDERITALRAAGMTDAAGLVLASDQDDARAYAEVMARVSGEAPELIVSDDPRASQRLARWATGTGRVAVCVRMVSEGVDVPRAACLAWLTSYRTPLFFAQAVGRVVRARGPHESATVFLPAVRPLLRLAADLETERAHVLPPPPAEADPGDLDAPLRERAAAETRAWEALDAEAEFAHVLTGGRAVLAGPALSAEEEDFVGLPGLLSAEQTASLLARRDAEHRRRASDLRASTGEGRTAAAAAPDDGASWRAAGDLRREVNRLVARVAARTGDAHAAVHTRLRRAVPGPPSAAAGTDLLAARRDHLLAQLARG